MASNNRLQPTALRAATEPEHWASAISSWYKSPMSPTVFRHGPFRFYFFSREEARMHVHVHHSDGEAKFWIEPEIELALNHGLTDRQINEATDLVKQHETEIRDAWNRHFGG